MDAVPSPTTSSKGASAPSLVSYWHMAEAAARAGETDATAYLQPTVVVVATGITADR